MSKETEDQSIEQQGGGLDEGANQEGSVGSTSDVRDRPAASGAQNVMVIAVAGLLIIGVIYYFFASSNKPQPNNDDNTIPIANNKPQTASDIPVPQLNASSSPSSSEIILSAQKENQDEEEKQKKEVAPLPPPVNEDHKHVAVLPPTNAVIDTQKKQLAQQQQARMKSNIMLRNGGDTDSSSAKGKRDVNSNFTPEVTSASDVKVTKVGNLSYLIVQGKIIEAVLETPINTTFPGPVRAVVSRDVFSEKGENVLVPKGSRLLGTFAQGIQNGHARVAIKWTRIVMPNGYDINIQDAPAVDSLGQIGAPGDIHREFFGIMGNAVLLSVMNVMLAQETQKRYNIQSSQTQTSTAPDGNSTTTTNTSPTQQAAQQEVKKLGSVTEEWFKENFQVKPYITIDQGTVIKVFVNQDVQFPSKIFSGVNNLG